MYVEVNGDPGDEVHAIGRQWQMGIREQRRTDGRSGQGHRSQVRLVRRLQGNLLEVGRGQLRLGLDLAREEGRRVGRHVSLKNI